VISTKGWAKREEENGGNRRGVTKRARRVGVEGDGGEDDTTGEGGKGRTGAGKGGSSFGGM